MMIHVLSIMEDKNSEKQGWKEGQDYILSIKIPTESESNAKSTAIRLVHIQESALDLRGQTTTPGIKSGKRETGGNLGLGELMYE